MTPRPPADWLTPELDRRLDAAPSFVAHVLLLADAAAGHGAVAPMPALVLVAHRCRDRLARRGRTP